MTAALPGPVWGPVVYVFRPTYSSSFLSSCLSGTAISWFSSVKELNLTRVVLTVFRGVVSPILGAIQRLTRVAQEELTTRIHENKGR